MRKALKGVLAVSLCISLTGCGVTGMFQKDGDAEGSGQETISFQSYPEGEEPPKERNQKEMQDKQEDVSSQETAKAGEEAAPAVSTNITPLDEAGKMAAQYDYDGAIALLQGQPGYMENMEMVDAVRKFTAAKEACVAWPIDKVTHVFYHTLIYDTSKAFDGDANSGGYDQVMTTIDEFNKITQSMYEKGFVMVRLEDMAVKNEEGVMEAQQILLPPGKQPFVLSQDDVSYYHYMDGDGMASRLVVDEDGKVKNEYIEDDGSVSVGDYDMVPLIDRFVEEHPDFSYKGAKGIIALTGYNGILGYRTDISYQENGPDLNEDKKAWLRAHPDFSLEVEREGARKVADTMRANGWEFASHTWGHQNVGTIDLQHLQVDTQRWQDNVAPIVGGSDKIIFAFGADLGGVEAYSNDKFEYLNSQGFDYFCNVDSSQYWVQLTDRYLRQGRRNLDGYRMYYNPDMVADLFDAASVFDPARPVPVPEM